MKFIENVILRTKQFLFNLKHSYYNDLVITRINNYYVKTKISGVGNFVRIGDGCYVNYPEIKIKGRNNRLVIGPLCHIGPGCTFIMEGNNLEILIEEGCSFNNTVHFCAQEDDVCIHIGRDCMFSNHIMLRTSDAHPIYAKDTLNRINPAQSIVFGDHVWVAPDSKILKGVTIGTGSIIGSNTIVTKNIPDNCLAVGAPAKVVRENIVWSDAPAFQI